MANALRPRLRHRARWSGEFNSVQFVEWGFDCGWGWAGRWGGGPTHVASISGPRHTCTTPDIFHPDPNPDVDPDLNSRWGHSIEYDEAELKHMIIAVENATVTVDDEECPVTLP